MITMGHRYNDYTLISAVTAQQKYEVGEDLGTYFRAEVITFKAEEDCYVRFGGDASVRHLIPKEDYISFSQKATRIFITRVSADGDISVWMEGDIAR